MIIGYIYFSGIIVAVILLSILAYYESRVKKENVDDLPAAFLMAVGSWMAVVAFILAYKETFKKILNSGFKDSE